MSTRNERCLCFAVVCHSVHLPFFCLILIKRRAGAKKQAQAAQSCPKLVAAVIITYNEGSRFSFRQHIPFAAVLIRTVCYVIVIMGPAVSLLVCTDSRVCISIPHTTRDDPMGDKGVADRWSPMQCLEKILLSVVSMLPDVCSTLNG
ncbi:hypothetical protein Z043_105212 [Scleropages formosus]|uniref:Uncharacterized protein n=1 Tax=Scleropages formosus TaxID=113540 RepID=A0A0P7VIV7_SCLFO|nr:hypothetical protein Z043_105212 [Scleropages formosus]